MQDQRPETSTQLDQLCPHVGCGAVYRFERVVYIAFHETDDGRFECEFCGKPIFISPVDHTLRRAVGPPTRRLQNGTANKEPPSNDGSIKEAIDSLTELSPVAPRHALTPKERRDALRGAKDEIEKAIKQNAEIGQRYLLSDEVGRGAFGIVAVAKDKETGASVAVKCHPETVLPGKEGDGPRRRVERTSRLQSFVGSRYAVKPLALIRHERLGFIHVEEYIHGAPLSKVLTMGQTVEEAHAISIGQQIVDALIKAWEAREPGRNEALRIVHRDVKPGNIVLHQEKNVYMLIDWGSCYSYREEGRDSRGLLEHELAGISKDKLRMTLTVAGLIIGTPRYMSPEQVIGQKSDCRADIYSLASTLYHLTTGTPAVVVNKPEDIFNIVYHDPMPAEFVARERKITLSTAFSDVLAKALQRERENRFPTPQEFLAALQACVK